MTAEVWCDQGFFARLYQIDPKEVQIGDELEVTADALYMTLHNNSKAKDVTEMTITSRKYRKPQTNVILLEDKKQRKCLNCDGFYKETDGYMLNDNSFICDGCLSHDYTVRDYCTNIGFSK